MNPTLVFPGSSRRGILRAWMYFFQHNHVPEFLQQRIPNLKTWEYSCSPHHHKNMLYRNDSPMTQSTSQPQSSERILFLSTVQGWGTWNDIPKCILPSPRLNEILNPCSSITPYSLAPSFWFFMQSLPFIPFCQKSMLPSFTSTLSTSHSFGAQRQDVKFTEKKYNHENTAFKETVTLSFYPCKQPISLRED